MTSPNVNTLCYTPASNICICGRLGFTFLHIALSVSLSLCLSPTHTDTYRYSNWWLLRAPKGRKAFIFGQKRVGVGSNQTNHQISSDKICTQEGKGETFVFFFISVYLSIYKCILRGKYFISFTRIIYTYVYSFIHKSFGSYIRVLF